MTPHIGQIVLYHVSSTDAQELTYNHTEGEDLPAIVVRVWSDTCVNLKIFADGPNDVWRTSVVLGDQPSEWSYALLR